jgi:hypothetical protein
MYVNTTSPVLEELSWWKAVIQDTKRMTPTTHTIPIGENTVNPTIQHYKLHTNPLQTPSRMVKLNHRVIFKNLYLISGRLRVTDMGMVMVTDRDRDLMEDNGINILEITHLLPLLLDKGGRFNNLSGTLYRLTLLTIIHTWVLQD